MEQSSFFNAEKTANGTYDRTYNAEDWAAYFATFVGNGVSCTPTTNLQVESSSGMNVIVNSGVAFINGYRYENTTPLTLQINQSNSTYDRITSIILELNLNTREILCKAVDGTAQPNPQPPILSRTNSIYQLQLATLYISAGTINCGSITDTRENKEVCGFLNLLAPTIPPTFIQNCELEDISLKGTVSNFGLINGGKIANGTLSNTNLVGEVNNFTTIKSGIYEDPTFSGEVSIAKESILSNFGLINGGKIANATLSNTNLAGEINNFTNVKGGSYESPTFVGNTDVTGTMNITKESVLSNFGLINGGKIANTTLNNANLTGAVNNFTTIKSGIYENPTFSGQVNITKESILSNFGLINGGKISNTTLNNANLTGEINNFTNVKGGSYESPTFVGNTDVTGTMNITKESVLSNFGLINGGKISNTTLNNANLTGAVNNFTTIKSGIYENPTFSGQVNITKESILSNFGLINGGKISNATLSNTNLTGEINNFTTVKGGEYMKANLSECSIQNGLFHNTEEIVNSVTVNQIINLDSNVQAEMKAEMWWMKGSLLAINSQSSVVLGVLNVSLIPKDTIALHGTTLQLNFSQIPNISASPLGLLEANNYNQPTLVQPFKASIEPQTVIIEFTGETLNANQLVGAYALIVGNELN